MPPEEAKKQPTASERETIVSWIRALRSFQAQQAAVQHVFDERGLARAADAGDADEPVEGNGDVDAFEIVLGGGANP